MAINGRSSSVQHNGGFLPGIILLTQCYYHHRGTPLNACAMKMRSDFSLNNNYYYLVCTIIYIYIIYIYIYIYIYV